MGNPGSNVEEPREGCQSRAVRYVEAARIQAPLHAERGSWMSTESGAEVRRLEGLAVAVTADGRRALSAGYDGTLRLWDHHSLATSQCRRSGPTARVRQVDST